MPQRSDAKSAASGNATASPPAGVCNSTETLQSYVHTGPLQPGSYFIIVDGRGPSGGSFHLTVTATP